MHLGVLVSGEARYNREVRGRVGRHARNKSHVYWLCLVGRRERIQRGWCHFHGRIACVLLFNDGTFAAQEMAGLYELVKPVGIRLSRGRRSLRGCCCRQSRERIQKTEEEENDASRRRSVSACVRLCVGGCVHHSTLMM